MCVAKVIDVKSAIPEQLRRGNEKTPFEEPDHLIKLLKGCTPSFRTTSECSNMSHDLPRTARFWSLLFAVDKDLAEKTRTNACP